MVYLAISGGLRGAGEDCGDKSDKVKLVSFVLKDCAKPQPYTTA